MIDLNCDVGELEDAQLEAALIEQVSSANIACGAHAGDETTMERTARMAIARGVRIGAHPSYPDRANFGRARVSMSAEELERSLLQQVLRLEAVVRGCGGRVAHVKPHGALYNAAARDSEIARAIGRAVLAWNPGASVFGLARSVAIETWRAMGLAAVGEAFADRRYEADGSLRDRRFADALIADPEEAAAQAVRLAQAPGVETICVHGDSPRAVEILEACRRLLAAE